MELSNKNNKSSFEDRWIKYYNKIFKRVIYITGNVESAEDITQEAFTKLYKSPPAHGNVEAWLKRISTNLAYNYVRDEKLKKEKNTMFLKPEKNENSTEENVVSTIENNITQKILNKLKPKEKLCLLLKFSGYKYNEISNIAYINNNSVGKTISRAQEKFKRLYIQEVEKNDL